MNKRVSLVVPLDCVDTYHIDGIHDANEYNSMAIKLMKQAGIKIVSKILF